MLLFLENCVYAFSGFIGDPVSPREIRCMREAKFGSVPLHLVSGYVVLLCMITDQNLLLRLQPILIDERSITV